MQTDGKNVQGKFQCNATCGSCAVAFNGYVELLVTDIISCVAYDDCNILLLFRSSDSYSGAYFLDFFFDWVLGVWHIDCS